jgi:hypothetical protein
MLHLLRPSFIDMHLGGAMPYKKLPDTILTDDEKLEIAARSMREGSWKIADPEEDDDDTPQSPPQVADK